MVLTFYTLLFPVKSAPAGKKSISAQRRCYGVVWGLERHVARRLLGQGQNCRGGTSFVVCLLVGWLVCLFVVADGGGSRSWWSRARNHKFGIWHRMAICFGFFSIFLEAFGSFSVEWLWAWPWLRPVAWISLDHWGYDMVPSVEVFFLKTLAPDIPLI